MPTAGTPRLTRSARVAWTGATVFLFSLLWSIYAIPDRLRHTLGEPYTGRGGYVRCRCCFHFSRCTTACWRGPARSGWSCGGCPRSWNDRSTPGSASLLFILVCSVWQAVPGTLYVLHGFWRALGYVVQLAGLVLTIRSSAALDVLDLAGVRQVQRASLGTPPRHVGLETTGLYGFVRHPLYFAWALMVFASPDMTATRATFAIVTTAVSGDRDPVGGAQPRADFRAGLRGLLPAGTLADVPWGVLSRRSDPGNPARSVNYRSSDSSQLCS